MEWILMASQVLKSQLQSLDRSQYWSTRNVASVLRALSQRPRHRVPPPYVDMAMMLSDYWVKRAFPSSTLQLISDEVKREAVWSPSMIIEVLTSLVNLSIRPYRLLNVISYELSAPSALTSWRLTDIATLAYLFGSLPDSTHAYYCKPDWTLPSSHECHEHNANQSSLLMAIGDRIMSQPLDSSLGRSGGLSAAQLIQILFGMCVHRSYHEAMFNACQEFFESQWTTLRLHYDDKRLLHLVWHESIAIAHAIPSIAFIHLSSQIMK
jgi:hypothetical protein